MTQEEIDSVHLFLEKTINPAPLEFVGFKTERNHARGKGEPAYVTTVTLLDPKTKRETSYNQNSLMVLRTIKRIYRYSR